ncbi:MAG TPA: hypothetical protein VF600_11700 [Abditibacteriaceae bacterium]|jgi:hypothetical protein
MPEGIHLELHTKHELYAQGKMVDAVLVERQGIYEENTLGLSTFGWTGDHYQMPSLQTQEWWDTLKQWIESEAKPLATFPEEMDDGRVHETGGFYAFPSAYEALKNGMNYYAYGWDVSDGLR